MYSFWKINSTKMTKVSAVLLLLVFAAVKSDDIASNAPVNLGVSYLTVVNNAAPDIIDTRVSGTKADEWGPKNAPQYNFQNVKISSGDSASRQANVNLNAKASHFTMEIVYIDQTREKYTINQQYAFDKSADFEHIVGDRQISYGKFDNHTIVITITN